MICRDDLLQRCMSPLRFWIVFVVAYCLVTKQVALAFSILPCSPSLLSSSSTSRLFHSENNAYFNMPLATVVAASTMKIEKSEKQEGQDGAESASKSPADDTESNGSFSKSSRIFDVQFASPLLDYGYPPTVQEYQARKLEQKPLLIYLPGFDGSYLCPFLQFPELGEDFDVRCMTVGMRDRSTFDDLRETVLEYLERVQNGQDDGDEYSSDGSILAHKKHNEQNTENNRTEASTSSKGGGSESGMTGGGIFSGFSFFGRKSDATSTSSNSNSQRPIYLAGESFGGILACEVARTLEKQKKSGNLKGLILINSATCYDRSRLADKGPQVAAMPWFMYPFGVLTQLLPLFGDEHSAAQLGLILSGRGLPSVIDTPVREAYMGRVAFSLPSQLKYMPQSTLRWRLREWLSVGCARLDLRNTSGSPNVRTLLVAGEQDRALPSIAEAERLASILQGPVQVHVVEGAGHASTCGSRIDLAAVLRERFPELRKQDQVQNETDSTAPTKRTAMKPVAAQGVKEYLGMEPRYDGARIGLSPLEYWSKEYYFPVKRKTKKSF